MSSEEDASSSWINVKSLRNAVQVTSLYKHDGSSSKIPTEQKANSIIHSSPSFVSIHKRYHSFVDEFINPDDTFEDISLLRNYKQLAGKLQQQVFTLEQNLLDTKRKQADRIQKYRVRLQIQQERHERKLTHLQNQFIQREASNRGSITERPYDELARIREEFQERLDLQDSRHNLALTKRDKLIEGLEERVKRLETEKAVKDELKKAPSVSDNASESMHLVEDELRDILGQIK